MSGLRYALEDRWPAVAAGAWLAPTATVIGDVAMAEGASLWFGAVLRADTEAIRIGARPHQEDAAHIPSAWVSSAVGRRATG